MRVHHPIKRMLIGAACAVAAAAAVLLTACGKEGNSKALTVGKDIAFSDITDFYYTYDSSVNPPEFLRYRFSASQGSYRFYYETRGGDHWPLTESDVTESVVRDLSQEEWTAFLETVSGGTVTKRQEQTETGSAGPWLFVYWNGDGGERQVFSFESRDKQAAFQALCTELKNKAGE